MHPIAEYRRARGLTQSDLARVLEASTHAVQMWEAGRQPRARILPKLAQALGVDTLALDRELRAWKATSEEKIPEPATS